MSGLADKYAKRVMHDLNERPHRDCRFSDQYDGSKRHYICPLCSEMLQYAYLENRIYSISCDGCSVVRLVEARNPEQAAATVGHFRDG